MVKIAFIISDINKARTFEWTAKGLDPKRFEQIYILINDNESDLEIFLKSLHLKVYRLQGEGKLFILKSIWRTINILKKEKINVVHCHLYRANIIGLLASRIINIKKRIYTRHFSTLHHDYHPGAVKFDKFLNSISTDIVAISINVREVLQNKEGVNPKKVKLIYHGFNLDEFNNVPPVRINSIREKYTIKKEFGPIIGVIARFTEWKGIQYIIPAFVEFRREYPNSHLVLANANGDWQDEINKMLETLPRDSVTKIEFEPDNPALYKIFTMYIHTPIDAESEAFGQTYIEALASEIPSIFTLSGISREFIHDRQNALVVDYKNPQEILAAMKFIQSGNYPQSWIQKAKNDVYKLFPLRNMESELEKLYLS